MGKKRKADEVQQDGVVFYEIEYIYAARRVAGKTDNETGWEFLVKWLNYPLSEITWEPYSNLKGSSSGIMKSFWKDTGFPNKSRYPPGYTVYASADFIKHWKRNAESANKAEIEDPTSSDDDKPLSEVLKLSIKTPSRHWTTRSSDPSTSVQPQESGADSMEDIVIQFPDSIALEKTLTSNEDISPTLEKNLTTSSADQLVDLTSKVPNDSPLGLAHRILQDHSLSPMLQNRLGLSYAGDQPTEFEFEISKLFSNDSPSPAIAEVSSDSPIQPYPVQPQSQSRSQSPVEFSPSIIMKVVNDRSEGMLFPLWLDEYMKEGERPYCIWADNSSSPQMECETQRLRLILKFYKNAVDVGYIPDVKIVFIHVGSLQTIQSLPSLPNRLNAFTTMFTLFGTDIDPSPFQWEFREFFPVDPEFPLVFQCGFWEIFPIGGIVTFTAGALLEDPVGIYLRIIQIAEHPLWAGYVVPSVFGMAVKLLYRDEDPLEAFDSGSFVYQDFLTAIDDGAIALVRSPSSPQGDPKWLHDQVLSQFRSCRETLEFCLQEFTSKYAEVAESEYASRLASEVVDDLTAMRIQPGIMRDYRRFVIFKQNDDPTSADYRSFEWIHASSFDIPDRFFDWKEDPEGFMLSSKPDEHMCN